MSEYEIEPLLDQYGIDYNPGRRGNQPIHCPNTDGHKNGDRTASASLHLDKGLFSCLACGAGGSAIDLIMLMEGVPLREAFSIAEAGSANGGRTVQQGTGRSEYGLPQQKGNHRRDGGSVSPWRGFR